MGNNVNEFTNLIIVDKERRVLAKVTRKRVGRPQMTTMTTLHIVARRRRYRSLSPSNFYSPFIIKQNSSRRQRTEPKNNASQARCKKSGGGDRGARIAELVQLNRVKCLPPILHTTAAAGGGARKNARLTLFLWCEQCGALTIWLACSGRAGSGWGGRLCARNETKKHTVSRTGDNGAVVGRMRGGTAVSYRGRTASSSRISQDNETVWKPEHGLNMCYVTSQ